MLTILTPLESLVPKLRSGRPKNGLCFSFKTTGMTRFKKVGGKNRVDFWQSYLIFLGPKKRNIRWFLTFKKGKNVQNCAGNRSVRSLDRDKMRIISIWTIRNYDTIFLDKM